MLFNRRLWIPAIFSLLPLSQGCLSDQQKTAISKFSAATSDFGNTTSQEFTSTRTEYIEMNTLRWELRDPAITQADFTKYFTIDDVKARVDAANALKQYGTLLNTLATDSETTNLKNSSDSFIASLKEVKGTTLTSNDYTAIGDAVQAVGGIFIEIMRANAVKTVVNKADDPVNRIVQLIENDFDSNGSGWSLGYSGVTTGLSGATDSALNKFAANDIAGAAIVNRAKATARSNQLKFDQTAAAIKKSGDALLHAEATLKAAINTGTFDANDIDNLVQQVQNFIQIYSLLNSK